MNTNDYTMRAIQARRDQRALDYFFARTMPYRSAIAIQVAIDLRQREAARQLQSTTKPT